jgi:uncharacterized membrane protein (DUF2068 family)
MIGMETAIPVRASARRNGGRLIVIAIGIIKLCKGTLMLLLAFAALALTRQSVTDRLWEWASELDVGPLRKWLGDFIVNKMLDITVGRLVAAAVGCTIYAALFFTEGIGLLMDKIWAEWVVVITTALLIPVEIWEIHLKWRETTLPLAALLVNVAIVLFLIFRVRKRIAEHHAETASLKPN